MPPPLTLADLAKSAERKIVEAYAAIVKADTLIADVFKPIILIETANPKDVNDLMSYSIAIGPAQIDKTDFPSSREKILVPILVAAFLPSEQTSEDSAFVGLDLGNHLRKLAWNNQTLANAAPPPTWMTFATVDFTQLTPLLTTEGVKILRYRTVYETDIEPKTGAFA